MAYFKTFTRLCRLFGIVKAMPMFHTEGNGMKTPWPIIMYYPIKDLEALRNVTTVDFRAGSRTRILQTQILRGYLILRVSNLINIHRVAAKRRPSDIKGRQHHTTSASGIQLFPWQRNNEVMPQFSAPKHSAVARVDSTKPL
jgi:hypothetical protein